MALDNFKKIENNKGYLVDDKDRKIFEREISKGYFGMNIGDTIEFVLYDSNDNPLPQESANGKTVRYIEYSERTKAEYFGKVQTTKANKFDNDSEEFFIDTEKLIKEAGYTNGIFKSQVSLLNRRLGSAGNEFDKLWIHEISPSRTEIRVLPTTDSSGLPNSDLSHRYDLFVNDKQFLPDVFPFIDNFIETFDVQKALESMLTIKGKVAEGVNYIKLIEKEFKIPNFEVYLKTVQEKFVESAKHFKYNREYNITSNNYGQPKGIQPSLNGDIQNIYNIMVDIATQCIEYYLPKRDIRFESSLTLEEEETLDELEKLAKTLEDNTLYPSTIPETIKAPTIGCKNPDAINYDENVDIHDESLCEFVSEIKICNDPNAINFGEPGVCEYKIPDLPVVCKDPNALNYGEVGQCIYSNPKEDLPDEISLSDRPRPTQEEIDEIIEERVDMAENQNTGIGGGALGGVELDLSDQNEKALYDIVVDTYNQVNEQATKQHFEDMNNKALEQFEPQEETRGQSTSGRSAGQGNSTSAVIDGKVKDRQVNQI